MDPGQLEAAVAVRVGDDLVDEELLVEVEAVFGAGKGEGGDEAAGAAQGVGLAGHEIDEDDVALVAGVAGVGEAAVVIEGDDGAVQARGRTDVNHIAGGCVEDEETAVARERGEPAGRVAAPEGVDRVAGSGRGDEIRPELVPGGDPPVSAGVRARLTERDPAISVAAVVNEQEIAGAERARMPRLEANRGARGRRWLRLDGQPAAACDPEQDEP